MKQVLEEVKAWALSNSFKGGGRYYEKKLPFGLLSIKLPKELVEDAVIEIDLVCVDGHLKYKNSKRLYLMILEREFNIELSLRVVLLQLIEELVVKVLFNE